MASGGAEAENLGGGGEELAKLREDLEECRQAWRQDREDMKGKMQDVIQKAKDKVRQIQEKMQQTVEAKDSRLQELDAEKAGLLSEMDELRSRSQQAESEALSEIAALKSHSQEAQKDAQSELAALRSRSHETESEALQEKADLVAELAALKSRSEGADREAHQEQAELLSRLAAVKSLREESEHEARNDQAELRSELAILRSRCQEAESEAQSEIAALKSVCGEREREALEAAERPSQSANDDILQEVRAQYELDLEKARCAEAALRSELREEEKRVQEAHEEKERLSQRLSEEDVQELRSGYEQEIDKARCAEDALRAKLRDHEEYVRAALEEKERQLESPSNGVIEDLRAQHEQDMEKARCAENALRLELREQEDRAREALEERESQSASASNGVVQELQARLEQEVENARSAQESLRSELREQEKRALEALEERESQSASASDGVVQELQARLEQEVETARSAQEALRSELREQEKRALEALEERESQSTSANDGMAPELQATLEQEVESARSVQEALRSELRELEERHCQTLAERESQSAIANDGMAPELQATLEQEVERARSAQEALRSELRELEERHCQTLAERESQSASANDGVVQDLQARLDQEVERARSAQEALRSELREQERRVIEALEERERQSESASDGVAQELRTVFERDMERARSAQEALRSELGEEEQRAGKVQEQLEQAKKDSEAKIAEIVRKAKEFSRQMQTRLESSVSENKELTEKCKEMDEAYKQQQDDTTKYRQLTAVANSRIEESDRRAKDLMEALSRSQAQRTALQEQVASIEKSLSMPPSREELEKRGGVQLAVEAEDEDIWCLIRDVVAGAQDAAGGSEPPQPRAANGNGRWWQLAQLDVSEKPIPLQKRWRGEVSALRAQMNRFKRKSEEVQEEFDSYKQKANAALQTGASHCEEIQLKSRQVEQLGEQLRAATLDVHRAHEDKAKAMEDLSEVRRRLQDTLSRSGELERALERRAREGEERCYAEVASCRSAFEAQREAMEVKWGEKERAFQQELDLRRAQKESLDEEVEGLRAMLASRSALAATAPPQPSAEEGGATASSAAAGPSAGAAAGAAAGAPAEAFSLKLPSEGAGQDGGCRPDRDTVSEPESQRSTRPSPRAFVDEPGGEAEAGATSQQQAMPQQNSYHASITWESIVKLRSQVRQLEISLQEERQQHSSTRREKEAAKGEIHEMNMQQSLSNTVGQRQQMEYIRNVFRKFIEKCPPGSPEHEQMIWVLTTFFKFPDEDAKAIQRKRQQTKSQGGFWNPLSSWTG